MSTYQTLLYTQYLISFALCIQSVEYLYLWKTGELREFISITHERHLSRASNIVLITSIVLLICSLLILFTANSNYCIAQLICFLTLIHYFSGPFNGGSDYLTAVILFSCAVATISKESHIIQIAAVLYIAVQSLLSYTISGLVKLKEAEWRNGSALKYFLRRNTNSALPHTLLKPASILVILFELALSFSILHPDLCKLVLLVTALFHLCNFYLFGLNRFFWVWISSYPSILYLSKLLEQN